MILKNNAQRTMNQRNSYPYLHLINEIQLPLQKSKQIQDLYEKAKDEERDHIFQKEISENIIRFCQDKYQHYIIICIIEKGFLNHKRQICSLVNQNLHLFFSKKYAYKIVQSCFFQSDIRAETEPMIKYVMDNIKKLQYGQYGSLIVGSLLESIQQDELHSKLINQLNIDKLKYHQYGCVLVIKIATKMKNVDNIVNKLILESIELTTSEFSNYIIQKMLTDRTIEQNKVLINEYLIPNFLKIACNKFGSNVCETMLIQCLAYQLMNLWHLVIKFHLRELVNNEFANYVMQTYYFHIQQFSYIAESLQQQLMELNKSHQLNKNGKIVYSNVIQCNQVIKRFF